MKNSSKMFWIPPNLELAIPQKTLNVEFLSEGEEENLPDRTLNADYLD